MSFTFYVQQFKSLIWREGHFGEFFTQRGPQNLVKNNWVTNVFLHYEFQLSSFSSSKVLFGFGMATTAALLQIFVEAGR